jgi:hypothetical protein
VLAVSLAACSFHVSAAVDGGTGDVSGDVPPAVAATPLAWTPHARAGVLGGTGGGSTQPDLACGVGELPIGFAFDMSGGRPANNQPVVVAIHVRCATIGRDVSGLVTSTPAELPSDPGLHGFCDFGGWTPSAMGAEMVCPRGQVMVGMIGNEAATSLYNTVAIDCAPFGGGAATTIGFPTGNFSNSPQQVACPSGAAIAKLGVNAGCGQDELIVDCAPIACD